MKLMNDCSPKHTQGDLNFGLSNSDLIQMAENFRLFETRFVRGNMDLCKSVSNNFDECSNQDSICDGGSMERTEAAARLKSIRGIWQNQPPMGFRKKIFQ